MPASSYPTEGVVMLYSILCGTQVYLAMLAAVGRLPRPGRVFLALRYATLACAFLWLALGTFQPPLIDLVEYRWLLRGSYVAYCLLALYQIGAYWREMQLARRRRLAVRPGVQDAV